MFFEVQEKAVFSKVTDFYKRRYSCQKQPLELFCKKSCSWKSRKFHRITPVLEPVRPATFIKRALTQVFFYEICQIFKNTYFLRTIVSILWK